MIKEFLQLFWVLPIVSFLKFFPEPCLGFNAALLKTWYGIVKKNGLLRLTHTR
jgi:hypothetical protein